MKPLNLDAKHDLRMFKINGGPPWVIAKDAADAIRLASGDEYGSGSYRLEDVAQMPDDELFTMTYEDGPPEGLTPDCQHPFDEDGDSFCEDCGEDRHAVTMTAAEWCRAKGNQRDVVIWEFQG